MNKYLFYWSCSKDNHYFIITLESKPFWGKRRIDYNGYHHVLGLGWFWISWGVT